MADIIVTCETLTPMITSGADQSEFELRADTVKSLLRFWWRAFHVFDTIEELREQETALFGGSTGTRKNAAPFRISVRVTELKPAKKEDLGFSASNSPRSYFYFPLRPGKFGMPRDAATPNFEIFIRAIQTAEQAKDLLRSLWLLEHLGAIGSRSRRGAGSFEVKEVKLVDAPQEILEDINHLYPHPQSFFIDKDELRRGLTSSIRRILDAWGPKTDPGAALPCYSRISDRARICIVTKPNGDPLSLMDDLADHMRNFRNGESGFGKAPLPGGSSVFRKEARIMHERIDSLLNGSTLVAGPTTVMKPEFGLPIQYRFGGQSKPPCPEPVGFNAIPASERTRNGQTSLHKLDRRASPLFLSFGQFGADGNRSSYCILTYLPAEFVTGETGDRPVVAFKAVHDTKKIENLINNKKKPPSRNYKLWLENRLTTALSPTTQLDLASFKADLEIGAVEAYLNDLTCKMNCFDL
ncbi:MAG: type III-B CRISPR module RAMP protein Cmr1 [Deltaproteobacteria bacterium]|nr:type III-B CRISPR module RAMP protein Cmr1 [Deltaproteobacteria bacterium]